MTSRPMCLGSNRWGEPADVFGKGVCPVCGRLMLCNSGGILFPHAAGDPKEEKC